MPVRLSDFREVSFSSGSSGARSVVVRNDNCLETKGLWQRIRLSFMHKSDRIKLNQSTMTAFSVALAEQFGSKASATVTSSDKWQQQFQEGKKLLSRDVHAFLKVCDDAQEKNKQRSGIRYDFEKATKKVERLEKAISGTGQQKSDKMINELERATKEVKRLDTAIRKIVLQEINESKLASSGSDKSESGFDSLELGELERALNEIASQEASALHSENDTKRESEFNSLEFDPALSPQPSSSFELKEIASQEASALHSENDTKRESEFNSLEFDPALSPQPSSSFYLARALGAGQDDDPHKVQEFVSNVYGTTDKEYQKILDTINHNQSKSNQKPDSSLTSEEAVSAYYCAYNQKNEYDKNDIGAQVPVESHYVHYPEQSICQERMSSEIGVLYGASRPNRPNPDYPIYPMLRQAISGLDKLPVYRGALHVMPDMIGTTPLYKKGETGPFKRFLNFQANGAPTLDFIKSYPVGEILIYNFKGDSCRDVSSLTGNDNEVLIKPDACFTCTNIVGKKSPEGAVQVRIFFFDVE